MAAIDVVQRLFQRNDLRSTRRTIATAIAQQFPLPLLPALSQLPLPLVDSAGGPVQLDAVLANTGRVLVAGATGSGRRLVLQQIALRWAATERAPFPALITLPMIDDETAPQALLARWLGRTQPATLQRIGPPLQATSSSHIGWGLLFDGLDELPDHRQHAWRTLLQEAPRTLPIFVAVAADEPAWEHTTRIATLAISVETLTVWIEQCVPAEQRAALRAALTPNGRLAPLGDHLLDTVLLLWAARSELPASRAAVYERVIGALLGARPAPTLDELQLLAAYDERPTAPAPGLLAVTASGKLRFVHPRLRDFLAARQLASEGRYDVLHHLAPPARTEIACFAASASADPAPLYATLWGDGRPSAENALLLGRCLREHPASSAAWVVRITAALARLARAGNQTQQAEAAALLAQTTAALDTALATFARADSAAQQAIMRLLRLLSPELAAARATTLMDGERTPAALAWELADVLCGLPEAPTLAPPNARPALARWAYIQACASPRIRARLAASDVPALDALAHSTAGDERIVRAAAAFARDVHLPLEARLTALALLSDRQHPLALATLQEASRDPQVDVRHAALAALSEHSPQQSRATLRQTVLDQRAALDVRRDALRRVAARGEDSALLAQCARDAALPLSMCLESVTLLGSVAGGAAQLRDMLIDNTTHPFVRAAAACQLGQIRDYDALPTLLQLLHEGATPALLVDSICGALGAIDSVSAIPALIGLLAHAINSDTLVAAAHVLGELKTETAIPYLYELLLNADKRLHDTLGALGPSTNTPLDPEQLPDPLGARLSTMLADASTAADPPTTFDEFLRREADRIRSVAAQALGAIGSDTARDALLEAFNGNVPASTVGEIVAALAALDGSYSVTTLGELLEHTTYPPLVRWFAIQLLRDHNAGETVLLRALSQTTLDPFTRGTVAEALGQRKVLAALAPLRQIADDPACDEHLRAQAILALGLIDDQTSEIALLRLVSTQGEPATLRGTAAEHVPTELSSAGRRALRELLRNQRPVDQVAAGALRALGRIGDHEALPLMLRYAQHESAGVAQAALIALTDVGDASHAPVLVQITQNPHIDASTRLQAVGTLLRIGGDTYLPLLRVALEQGSLPLRLQALEHLLDTHPPLADLLPTLASHVTPLPMRMRLFQYCADQPAATTTLVNLLADSSDDAYVRGLAASALAQQRDSANTPLFAQIASDNTAFIGLRLRCVVALAALADASAISALDALADDSTQPASIRRHAAQVLLDHAARLSTIDDRPPTTTDETFDVRNLAGHGA